MLSELKFEQQGIKTGNTFKTEVTSLGPNNEINVDNFKGEIEGIRGGGFYGKVLIFENSVIKTAQTDPWHELWRQANWRIPFPSQGFETAAILDHLSTRMINRTISAATKGYIETPESYGYINLGKLGFAQHLERMYGRGTDFDPALNENRIVSEARKRIWEIGQQLGFEGAAQVHPDNPFGKPNIWLSEGNRIVWLDVLPAIKHTGFVLPFFRFAFHKDVREKFNKTGVTFNKVHTQRTRQFLTDNPHLFSKQDIDELFWYSYLYEQYYADYEEIEKLNLKTAWDLSQLDPWQLERSAIQTLTDFVQKMPPTSLIFNSEARSNFIKFWVDKDYRSRTVLEGSVLRGAKKAHENGLISDEKFNELIEKASEKELRVYTELQVFFAIMARVSDGIAGSIAVSSFWAQNPEAIQEIAFKTFLILPSVIKFVSSLIVQSFSKVDLKRVIATSWIPTLGTYGSIPWQMSKLPDMRSEVVWKYTKRWLVSFLSRIRNPATGGWGTDLEEKLWEQLNK